MSGVWTVDRPTLRDPVELAARRSWQSRWTSCPSPASAARGSRCRRSSRCRAAGSRGRSGLAHGGRLDGGVPAAGDIVRADENERQIYRLRAPASGREAIAVVEGDGVYVDRVSGEELEPVTRALPLAPSESACSAHPRTCGVPPVRPTDRPRRHRLPLLRPAPARSGGRPGEARLSTAFVLALPRASRLRRRRVRSGQRDGRDDLDHPTTSRRARDLDHPSPTTTDETGGDFAPTRVTRPAARPASAWAASPPEPAWARRRDRREHRRVRAGGVRASSAKSTRPPASSVRAPERLRLVDPQ